MSQDTIATRLETYTLQHPQEVLVVHAQIEQETDEIIIFRGFSSSLMRPTDFDPEVPVLPREADISYIDRLKGPYQPQAPQYIEKEISLEEFISRLL
ncbi:hypothetical protein S7335_1918 [Synechococcus sp. PCC 7335]|uniref:DUF7734 family protein n=1 Tax=Synechococcus sp. (strain ATCC 29403 / PCC 7335) TaxID=91464 RepID=UPI00017EC71B|nr:hypothetical protein [Synechococcus sp. PCC 7335]EDX84221.1 hypothetical protein S7335_1918 [Synechococcus sp. PCC 7335]